MTSVMASEDPRSPATIFETNNILGDDQLLEWNEFSTTPEEADLLTKYPAEPGKINAFYIKGFEDSEGRFLPLVAGRAFTSQSIIIGGIYNRATFAHELVHAVAGLGHSYISGDYLMDEQQAATNLKSSLYPYGLLLTLEEASALQNSAFAN